MKYQMPSNLPLHHVAYKWLITFVLITATNAVSAKPKKTPLFNFSGDEPITSSISLTNLKFSDSIQPDSVLKLFKTTNGDEIIGRIQAINPKETTILLQDGRTVVVPSYMIKSIEVAPSTQIKDGEFFYPNPHPSRYFYTPTALPMNKGELYIQSIYFLTMQIQYGVTKNLSVGFSTTIAGLPILGTAKYSFPINKNNTFALGGQFGSLSYASPTTRLGTGFACFTHGNAEGNITAAGGFFSNSRMKYIQHYDTIFHAWIDDPNIKKRVTDYSPAFSICGNKRLSKNISIMGEFWYLSKSKIFFGGPCLRLFNNKKATYDFGVWIISANNFKTSFPMPVFSYSYKFDK